ncbi:MAG: hypothetical protein V1790_17880 [Planctomycetota bacterium]
MPRLARIVVPGIAHHVTQGGEWGTATYYGNNNIDDPTDGERSEREHYAIGKASTTRASGMRTRPQ